MYCTRDQQDAAARRYIDTRRQAAALYPMIAEVVRAFDGKVYNCRFERALQERTGARIICHKYTKGIGAYIYEHGEQITLCWFNIEDMTDGKRIPAAKVLEDARDRRQTLLQDAASMERTMQEVDAIKTDLRHLQDMHDAILRRVPYSAKDIYDIK